MDYVICILIGLCLGIFACVVLYALIVAHPMQPDILKPGQVHGPYGGQPYTPDPPPPRRKVPLEVAQMPVIEAGCVSYQWINLTGLEDES